jgi:hypothetical protein
MTLRNRIQDMERRAGAATKDPAEMTLAELCTEIVRALEGEEDRLRALLGHVPDDVLRRQLDAMRHATKTGSLALINGAELSALLHACAEGAAA